MGPRFAACRRVTSAGGAARRGAWSDGATRCRAPPRWAGSVSRGAALRCRGPRARPSRAAACEQRPGSFRVDSLSPSHLLGATHECETDGAQPCHRVAQRRSARRRVSATETYLCGNRRTDRSLLAGHVARMPAKVARVTGGVMQRVTQCNAASYNGQHSSAPHSGPGDWENTLIFRVVKWYSNRTDGLL